MFLVKSKRTALVGATAMVAATAAFAIQPKSFEVPLVEQVEEASSTISATDSSVDIFADVSFATIEAAIEAAIPNEYSDRVADPTDLLTEDSASVYFKRGDISVFPDGNGGVAIAVPFYDGSANIQGRFGTRRKNKGPLGWFEELTSTSVSETATFAGQVVGTLSPVLREDYTIDPRASLTLNMTEAKVKLVGNTVPISFRGVIEENVQRELRKAIPEINRQIAHDNSLREAAASAWGELHNVQRIHESPNVWIKVEPSAFKVSEVVVHENGISFGMGIDVQSGVYVQKEAPTVERRPVAPLIITEQTEFDAFELLVPVSVELNELERALRKLPEVDRSHEFAGGKVEITSLALTGRNGRVGLMASISIDGGFFDRHKGTVYLTGEPLIDTKEGIVRMKDVRLDSASSSVLLDIAADLSQDKLIEIIESAAHFDLNSAEGEFLEKVNVALDAGKKRFPDGFEASLSNMALSVPEIRVAGDKLLILVTARGEAKLMLADTTDENAG